MSAWTAKRFWTDVNVAEDAAGFAICLDARPVKTPAKAPLIVPTRRMAEAVAMEWTKVDTVVDPNVMPFTRSANAAIDKVAVQFDEVAELIAAYGGSDLLCYRAENPTDLVARQAEAWDPLLAWTVEEYGAELRPTAGVMPVDQPREAVAALAAKVYAVTPFELTALHDLVAMSGSLVIGLAVAAERLDPDTAWALSRIDEQWQIDQWGEDEEAAATARIKQSAFNHAAAFYQMSK
ncbi:MAG: ATPase [Octadecabacter sp.]|nr:ATPase [Octadecabacter sp.]